MILTCPQKYLAQILNFLSFEKNIIHKINTCNMYFLFLTKPVAVETLFVLLSNDIKNIGLVFFSQKIKQQKQWRDKSPK